MMETKMNKLIFLISILLIAGCSSSQSDNISMNCFDDIYRDKPDKLSRNVTKVKDSYHIKEFRSKNRIDYEVEAKSINSKDSVRLEWQEVSSFSSGYTDKNGNYVQETPTITETINHYMTLDSTSLSYTIGVVEKGRDRAIRGGVCEKVSTI